jgi:hypothetical protein
LKLVKWNSGKEMKFVIYDKNVKDSSEFENLNDAINRVWFRSRSSKREFIEEEFKKNIKEVRYQFKIENIYINLNMSDELKSAQEELDRLAMLVDLDNILFKDNEQILC